MIQKLLTYPDHRLRFPSQPVGSFDDAFKQLCVDLKDTVTHHNGLGLSAIQINVAKRVFVMQTAKGWLTVVNPTWEPANQSMTLVEEGCLSVPGQTLTVDRYTTINAKYQDENGKEFVDSFTGLEAQIFQHEKEHLDGKLLIDKMNRLKREMLRKKLLKLKKNTVGLESYVQEISR